ncbi:uncharacterized protein LOC134454727 isoform X2 [Engraulis encrasicolus]|uniref:uncharacterized protein LOC134454727 isoform X2 n=1 Tax=Engraulis encrasicolus TaxID=184585 RepID=UPI002FD5D0D7
MKIEITEMEDVGQEEMEPSCCTCWRAIFTRFSNSRKRRVKQPSENHRVSRVLNRLRRRLKERQAQAAGKSSVSGSQKATETNQVTATTEVTQQAQVTGADSEPLIWSRWFITQQRRKLELQAEAAKAAASKPSLHKTQTGEATETIEIPQGAMKTIEVSETIEDHLGQEVMASDLPDMAEEAATQETRGCWGDDQSTHLEDEATEKAKGEQGPIPEDDVDSVSSFSLNCSELDRILNMEECDMNSLSSSLQDLVMERQYNMYEDPETVSIASSSSDLSELERLYQSQDHLDVLSNGTSISDLGLPPVHTQD